MGERRFTREELGRLAKWEVIDSDFCPENLIEMAAKKVRLQGYVCKTSRENGLANYYIAFTHVPLTVNQKRTASFHHPIRLDGVTAYFNRCVPVAAFARTSAIIAAIDVKNELTISSSLSPNLPNVIDPVPGNDPIVDAILHAFLGSPYEFWNKDDLSEPLPLDVEPFEYCLGDEPWDRVFHVLFANTD